MNSIFGYTFKDAEILKMALTHRSAPVSYHYERLEFLGDRVLNLCVAELLYAAYPNAPEGELAKRHAALVREETLADVALELNLAAHIILSAGEERTGGRSKPSILADIMEAVLAAMYLDSGGLAVPQKCVQDHWHKRLDTVELLDAKSALQEHLQGQGEALPTYTVVAEAGQDHVKEFTIEVATAQGNATGTGITKQAAAQKAAAALLQQLGLRK